MRISAGSNDSNDNSFSSSSLDKKGSLIEREPDNTTGGTRSEIKIAVNGGRHCKTTRNNELQVMTIKDTICLNPTNFAGILMKQRRGSIPQLINYQKKESMLGLLALNMVKKKTCLNVIEESDDINLSDQKNRASNNSRHR